MVARIRSDWYNRRRNELGAHKQARHAAVPPVSPKPATERA